VKLWIVLSLTLFIFARCVRATTNDPPPAASGTVTTSARADRNPSSTQEIDRNLTLIKGNNASEARKLGATKLLEAGSAETIAKLAGLLQSKTPDLAAQIAVCTSIAGFERPSPLLLEPLMTLLGDSRPGLGEVLIPALHRFDSALLIERLQPIAADRSQARSRRLAAILVLGSTADDKNAVAALAALLDDPSRSVQAAALAAFAQATGAAHEDAKAALSWWQARVAMSQVEWLRTIHEARCGQVRAITAEKAELTKRLIAAYRDAYLQTPETGRSKFLQSLLDDAFPAIRSLGLDLINDLITDRKEINQELRPLIVEKLTDSDPKVRTMAARIVSDLRLTTALVKLTDAVALEAADDVRAAQVAALGRLDDVKAVPTLQERMNDESPMVVGEAAGALGSLARRGRADADLTSSVSKVLLDRYKKTSDTEVELREKLLLAMTNIGTTDFLPVFEREMAPDRSIPVRRAAIAGLAAAGDPSVAQKMRPLLSAAEFEIRLAVMDAMGKCGRSKEDLDALAIHLGAQREPDAGVRQRAWESYLLVVQHLTPDERFLVGHSFDLPDDRTAQRRRLDVLKALRTDATAYESLPSERRIDLLEQTADAQLKLADFVAAAASLEQATGLLKDPASPRYPALAAQCVEALLHGREDAHAIRRLAELTDGESINGELHDIPPLADVVRQELRARISGADDATNLEDALRLISLSTEFARKVGPSFEQEIDTIRTVAISKRDAAIDHLLAALANDPDAENKLIKDNPAVVLSRIYQILTAAPTGSAPVAEAEERLVKLARRLAPQWQGYPADAVPEKKAAALSELSEICKSSKQVHRVGESIESTTSAPIEKKIGLHTAEGSSDQ